MNPNTMNLYSGLCVDPTEMTPEDVRLVDIAHPLSLLCRGTGQVRFFFSVGQHSINCALEAEARGLPRDIQLAALLHDAGEAYTSDVIRPVKRHLQGYTPIEKGIQRAILEKFGVLHVLEGDGWQEVRSIDDGMLTHEANALFTDASGFVPVPLAREPIIAPAPFLEVEKRFTQMVNQLAKEKE